MVESAKPQYSEFTFKSKITQDFVISSADNLKQLADFRAKLAPGTKIMGTHSEVFHCDEVLATAMLRYTKQYENAALIRTRAQEVLDELDIVCDVGGVFDASKNRFDHHQRSFNMAWHEEENKPAVEGEPVVFKIKLSSAGLIYKYFGKEVLKNILSEIWPHSIYSESDLDKIH